jgi:hypothetical protein
MATVLVKNDEMFVKNGHFVAKSVTFGLGLVFAT